MTIRKRKSSRSRTRSRRRHRSKSRSGSRSRVKRGRSRSKSRHARGQSRQRRRRSRRRLRRRTSRSRSRRVVRRSTKRAMTKNKQQKKTESAWSLSSFWPGRRAVKRKPSQSRHSAKRRCRARPLYNPMPEPHYMRGIKFNRYINKIRRKVLPTRCIDHSSMDMLDNIMKNVMHTIGTEARYKMGRRKILNPKILLRALRKVMPKPMRERADKIGQKAVERCLRRGSRRVRHRRF